MDRPFIVVGLGNPGSEYETTRHNVGFLVLDELSRRFRVRFRIGKGEYCIAQAADEAGEIILVKPLTYVNNSGSAISDVLSFYDAAADQLLVIIDDVALPLGKLRIRPRGSDGGHNGLASIIEVLQTEHFARLRCGIRSAESIREGMMSSFVLSAFDRDEWETARKMIKHAADAVIVYAASGIERTMGMFNK